MNTPPLKKEKEQQDRDGESDEVDELQFNHLHVSQHLYKRTIEGSPMITNNRKRTDMKATPDMYRSQVHTQLDGYDYDPDTNVDSGSSFPYNLSSMNTPSKNTLHSSPPLTPESITLSLPEPPLQPISTVTNNSFTGKQVSQKVFVITSGTDTGAQHHTTPGHQENAKRTALLAGTGDTQGCLYRSNMSEALIWANDVQIPAVAASMADILRVHDYPYIQHLNNKCQQMTTASNAHSSLPFFYAPPGNLDCDTPLSQDSLDAARTFCGAAIRAVDVVLNAGSEKGATSSGSGNDSGLYSAVLDPVQRAFVIGRPPGHHAGPSGCVPSEHFWLRPDMTSSGFCLLNTVAVAAAYARYNYSIVSVTTPPPLDLASSLKSAQPAQQQDFVNSRGVYEQCVRGHPPGSRPLRVAIVDIDVHHGNGTEEIVKNLSPHMTYLPLPSSWAPVGQVTYKPWLNEQDADEVFFASINLFAEDRFYPCSGRDTDPPPSPSPSPPSSLASSRPSVQCQHSHGTRRNAANKDKDKVKDEDGEGSINYVDINTMSTKSSDRDRNVDIGRKRGETASPLEQSPTHFQPQPFMDSDVGGTRNSNKSSSNNNNHSDNQQGNIINIAMTPIGPGPWDPHGRSKLTVKQREILCKKASRELRDKVSRSLLPRLRNFSADLLLFSSGFDAHYDDLYHFLTEEDFHWLTKEIIAACSSSSGEEKPTTTSTNISTTTTACGGHQCKVVSVLEGGYSLSATVPALPAKKPMPRKGVSKSAHSTDSTPVPPHAFAACVDDGGLVKGVLAHVAALASTEDWLLPAPSPTTLANGGKL